MKLVSTLTAVSFIHINRDSVNESIVYDIFHTTLNYLQIPNTNTSTKLIFHAPCYMLIEIVIKWLAVILKENHITKVTLSIKH